MTMPTDKTEAAPAPSARIKSTDPRPDPSEIHGDSGKPSAPSKKWVHSPTRLPAIVVGVVVAVVAALSIWDLVRPLPLLVQGEVDATRFDIAARVDGRVAEIPVVRGQDIAAGAVLVRIDNPETIAKNQQELAARIVAESQLAHRRAQRCRTAWRPLRPAPAGAAAAPDTRSTRQRRRRPRCRR